jgi:hypothetical protein
MLGRRRCNFPAYRGVDENRSILHASASYHVWRKGEGWQATNMGAGFYEGIRWHLRGLASSGFFLVLFPSSLLVQTNGILFGMYALECTVSGIGFIQSTDVERWKEVISGQP